MPFVYILQDKVSRKYYTGSCVSLSTRLKRHQSHTAAVSTRKGHWSLVWYKELNDLSEARKLEKKIKSYKGGNAFKELISGELAEWPKAPHC